MRRGVAGGRWLAGALLLLSVLALRSVLAGRVELLAQTLQPGAVSVPATGGLPGPEQGAGPVPVTIAVAEPQSEPVVTKIELVGDGMLTSRIGIGRGVCANLEAAVNCVDAAVSGASPGSYREQGLWAKALGDKPAYMVIGFGEQESQNAATGVGETGPKGAEDRRQASEYREGLRRLVLEAREAGIVPILVTPLARRRYDEHGKLEEDRGSRVAEVRSTASEENVALIDLYRLSADALKEMTPDQAATLALTMKDPDGGTRVDETQVNWLGSYFFGRMVAVGVGAVRPEIAGDVRQDAALLPEQGQKAMHVLEGAAVKIVLVGDGTMSAEGGWGKGFCAVLTANVTCLNEARAGQSAKSYYEEEKWQKALADRGDYYLIQFGESDVPGSGAERETNPKTTYAANLKRYIDETRAAGAVPVIVTSLAPRRYKDGVLEEGLKEYADAAKDIAAQENVTVLDLNATSVALLKGMTEADAEELDVPAAAGAAKQDGPAAGEVSRTQRTQLNPVGQALFGRMVADELARNVVELGPDVRGQTGAGKQTLGNKADAPGSGTGDAKKK